MQHQPRWIARSDVQRRVALVIDGVDEPVPPLCDRCAELQQRKLRMSDAPMHAASDCAEYCG